LLQNGPVTNGRLLQFLQVDPQAVVSVIWFTHVALQTAIPCGHPQTPAAQDAPAAQACPQAPQLPELLCRSTQLPLQLVWPAGH
jgi:hypothetical protein